MILEYLRTQKALKSLTALEEDPAHGIHLQEVPDLAEASEAEGINIRGRGKEQKCSSI